ncbi:MAG TPA: HAD family phosphatase [Streptosporangiaceae bacterium]
MTGSPDGGALGCVLFDMDGLLVDTEPVWFEAERAVMARLGGSWADADQRELVGGSLAYTVSYMQGRAQRPVPPGQIASWLLGAMTELLTERGATLMPGAAELLAGLDAAGIPRGLVTSTQRQIMTAVLASTGLAFAVTVCGEDVRAGKPGPEPYLRAAALLGEPPGRCVALEDSPNGVASALAAGCPVIAVPSLHPIPARPGCLVAGSLREVTLPLLRGHAEAAARYRT